MVQVNNSNPDPLFFFGQSLAGQIARSVDWSLSTVGTPINWSNDLKIILSMLYRNHFPLCLFWGSDQTFFYNDGYIPILGQKKHPWAMGQKGKEIWKEVWDVISPQIKQVMSGGPSTWYEDQYLPILGNDGTLRDAYFTYCYSPVYLLNGEVGGVIVTCTETTKKKQFENHLKKTQESLNLALSSAQMGAWELSLVTNKVTLSKEARKILGFAEEYTNTEAAINDFIHPEDRTHVKAVLAEAIKTGIAYTDEYRVIRPDGEILWIHSRGRAIFDKGKPVILSGVILDITQNRKNQEELQYQSQLTQTITDNAASCLFMMDKQGRPTFMNPAAMEVTGYHSLEEIKDKPLHYAVHWKKPDGSHYPMEECPIDNAQAQLKKVQNQEEIFCSKDGRLFPVSYSITPLEKNGEVVGSVLEFRDISEKKRVDDSLHRAVSERDKSLETLSTIIRTGQRLTSELDQEKLVQEATDVATQLTGAQFGAFFYNSHDIEGKTMLLYVVSGVSREAFAQFPNPRATEIFHPTFIGAGTVRSADITKDPRYGKNSPYKGIPPGHLPVRSYLAVSVVSRTGEVIGGLFFGHEEPNIFTEQAEKIAEGLAAQTAVAMDNAGLYRKAQEAVQARDEFLSIASHELKTPLTSMKLQAQIRTRRINKGEMDFDFNKLKKMFEDDSRQVERLSRLIDDMLDISRINSGKLLLQYETFDLCELIHDVLERHSSQINDSGSSIDLKNCLNAKGKWDQFRIEQVFTNLLTNALRYGEGKEISVVSRVDDSFAYIIVQDQGIGIAEENQQRIFQRFERAISANDISGLGLGLYIVKKIIDMHNGLITLESEIGKGAKFIVQLPLDKE